MPNLTLVYKAYKPSLFSTYIHRLDLKSVDTFMR